MKAELLFLILQAITRDAIDTDVKWNGKEYVFIDTAGIRRKSKVKKILKDTVLLELLLL